MNESVHSTDESSVLVVDDRPANLKLLSEMMRRRGYKVRTVVSGRQALQAVREDPPDIILLDIDMPEMNGYEVCSELKSDEKSKAIPIIFLSALNETGAKMKAFRVGGVDYITKPFQFEEVGARVGTHLELRRQRLRLQENYDKLRELEALRDSLVHMIIHDLRSPLMALGGHLNFIEEDKNTVLSPDSVDDIARALEASNKMIQIISDVLDTSKMEAGQMVLNAEECDLSGILNECVAEMKPLFDGRVVRLTLPENPSTITADGGLVSRVILNLLANAIKSTIKDVGLIRLGLGRDGDRVRVSVEDNGIGIAPEHRQKIFEKFGQVALCRGGHKYSTGLGLTFCKLAVEAHGGRIGVDSEEGKGSSFWFELPVSRKSP